MIEISARISAPHFVAGLILHGSTVHQAAPIVGYMKGWSAQAVKHYCDKRGWTIARTELASIDYSLLQEKSK